VTEIFNPGADVSMKRTAKGVVASIRGTRNGEANGALFASVEAARVPMIGKLRSTFLGFVSAVTVVCFLISHRLSMYMIRPVSQLTTISAAIGRGNFNVQPDLGVGRRCWQTKECGQTQCPAHRNTTLPRWYVDDTPGLSKYARRFPEKMDICRNCPVY
jgi:hypothetical protein